MECVIKAVTSLHAQTAMVDWALAATHLHDLVVFDMVGDSASYSTIRANRIDCFCFRKGNVNSKSFIKQRSGGTDRSALTARHTGRLSHRQVQVEADMRMSALSGATNNLVVLDVVTPTNT